MTVHNYKSRQVHETLIGVNPSSCFRDMRSAKSGPNLCQIWQVFGPWASPYGANGQMTMTVHNYRPRQFHRTLNGENPSSGYRDMGSASLAAACPPARTVTTIPLQPGGLRGKNAFYKVTRHWPKILNKMLHYWPVNLRVARKFTGLPPKKGRFTVNQRPPLYLITNIRWGDSAGPGWIWVRTMQGCL